MTVAKIVISVMIIAMIIITASILTPKRKPSPKEEVDKKPKKDTGKEKKEPRYWVGWLTRSVIAILLAINIYAIFHGWWKGSSNAPKSIISSSPTYSNKSWKPVLLRPQEPEGKDVAVVRKFWKEKGFNEIEVKEMVINCQNESGCNQFDNSNEVVTNLNQNGSRDFGLFQINDYWWSREVAQESKKGNKEIESYDIKTLEGNLMAALYLRKKYGLNPWSSESRGAVKTADIVLDLEADEWSEEKKTPRGFVIHCAKNDAVITFRLFPSGQELSGTNDSNLRFDRPESIRLKSNIPAIVFISFK